MVTCSQSGSPGNMLPGSKGTMCMRFKVQYPQGFELISQTCDFDAVARSPSFCELHGIPQNCCTVEAHGLTYQMMCAGTEGAFATVPAASDFADCSAKCDDISLDTTTTTTLISACQPWCESDPNGWSKKCSWRKCKGCTHCTAVQPPVLACEQWCAENAEAWPTKCTWNKCEACDACSGRRLENRRPYFSSYSRDEMFPGMALV
jgi:hypothetical protein